jgi:hypothetical protein
LEVFERRPQAAEFAAPTVTDRHPKTFTYAEVAILAGTQTYVMLPGIKHLIETAVPIRKGQTIVRPARFGSVITELSGTSNHLFSRRTR